MPDGKFKYKSKRDSLGNGGNVTTTISSDTKQSDQPRKGDEILQYGTNCNLTKWRRSLLAHLMPMFGIIATFVETLEPFKFKRPRLEDIVLEDTDESPDLTFGEDGDAAPAPAGTTVSEDIKKTVFTELLKSYAKDVASQKNSNVKMYAEIWRKMSLESQAKVQEDVKYFEINIIKDPCSLLNLVVKTHSTTVTGTPDMN